MISGRGLVVSLCVALLWAFQMGPSLSSERTEWPLTIWEPHFDYNGKMSRISYVPAQPASRVWRLCVSYPHMKDAYWLSVNYGMVEESRRLGVSFELVEAGGYPNLSRQIEQITDCVSKNVDALIVGTVSYRGLTPVLVEISKKIPVLATVNDIADEGITAKAGVSWYEMSAVVGRWLAKRHPPDSDPVRVAWFPGPAGAGWVDFHDAGFREAIQDTAVEIVETYWGDTGKEIQRTLVQEALDNQVDIDYIVGNALMAEAAISVLRRRNLTEQISILSTYFTHGVFRGIKRGRIKLAPTDSPVVQGRLSINQVVRILEGEPYVVHAGPAVQLLDKDSISNEELSRSLAPPTFLPTFSVSGTSWQTESK